MQRFIRHLSFDYRLQRQYSSFDVNIVSLRNYDRFRKEISKIFHTEEILQTIKKLIKEKIMINLPRTSTSLTTTTLHPYFTRELGRTTRC